MRRADKREHLIKVAARLFNRQGYHATGIDQVIAEARVAKTTLYRHFNSKDELIVAVLKRIDETFRSQMMQTVDRLSPDADGKILATFDFLERWFAKKTFYGCPFMSAAVEFGDGFTPIFQAAATHKQLMVGYFEALANAANLDDPQRVAEEINLLHQGATAVAHVTGDAASARKARALAARIVDEARRP